MIYLSIILFFTFITSSIQQEEIECLSTSRGENYAGSISQANNRTCSLWYAVQALHSDELPISYRKLPSNYCRNPDNDTKGPWCYIEYSLRKAYCDIPTCTKQCRKKTNGSDYVGTLDVAESGRKCLYWSYAETVGDRHFQRRYSSYWNLKHNYCRNIGGQHDRPWCFTGPFPYIQTECNVPVCEEQIKCFDGIGRQYDGIQDTSENGTYCMRWNVFRKKNPYWLTAENLHTKSIDYARNYCRNPTGDARGPYCYVRKSGCPGNMCKEYCSIPKCERNSYRLVCKENNYAQTYNGTSTNWECAYWSSPMVLKSLGQNPVFPLNNPDLSENFCRNPTKDPKGPYCLIQKPGDNFEKHYCSIPNCDHFQSIPHNFVAYPLSINQTCIQNASSTYSDTFDIEDDYANKDLFQIIFKSTSDPLVLANVKMCKISEQLNIDWPQGHYCLPFASSSNETCPKGFIKSTTIPLRHQFSPSEDSSFSYNAPEKFLCCRNDAKSDTMLLHEDFLANISHGFGFLTYQTSCRPIFNMTIVFSGDVLRSTMRLCIYKIKEEPKPKITSLGFLQTLKCPENHNQSQLITLHRITFYVCSHENITSKNLPPGRYCLAALNASQDCPPGMLFALIYKFKLCCFDNSSDERGEWPTHSSNQGINLIGLNRKCPDIKYLNPPIAKPLGYLYSFVRISGQISRYDLCSSFRGCRLTECSYEFPQSTTYERDLVGVYIRGRSCPNNWNQWSLNRFRRVCLVPSESLPMGYYCVYKFRKCPKAFTTRGAYCCQEEGIVDKKYDWTKLENVSFTLRMSGPRCQQFARMSVIERRFMKLCSYTTKKSTEVSLLYPISRIFRGRYSVCRSIMGLSLKREWSYRSRYYTGCIMKFNVIDLPRGEYCFVALSECPEGFTDEPYPLRNTYICCQTKSHSDSNQRHYWPMATERIALFSKTKECAHLEGFRDGLSYSMPNWTCLNVSSRCHSNNFGVNQFCYYQTLKNYSSYEIKWPQANFSLPKVLGIECPTGLSRSKISHEMESEENAFAHSDEIHLDGIYAVGHSYIEWIFCGRLAQKVHPHSKIDDKIMESFPDGQYCIAQSGEVCPDGFSSGRLSITEEEDAASSLHQENLKIPKMTRNVNQSIITYYFCCRADIDDPDIPILLPTQQPFYLFGYGNRCQNVSNTTVSSEFICFDAEDSTSSTAGNKFDVPYFITGTVPVTGSKKRGCDVQVNLCYYTPASWKPVEEPPYISNENISHTLWPTGSYGLFRSTYDSCPVGFQSGKVRLASSMHFRDGDSMNFIEFSNRHSTIYINVCTGGPLYNQMAPTKWPPGLYCVIKDRSCPPGLQDHPMSSFSGNHEDDEGLGIEGEAPNSFMIRNPKLCCNSNNSKQKLRLPNTHPFILIKHPKAPTCAEVINMQVFTYELEDTSDKTSSNVLCYYVNAHMHSMNSWPRGNYYLPFHSIKSCPKGFQETIRVHQKTNDKHDEEISIPLCHRKSDDQFVITNDESNDNKWPNGSYCVLVPSNNCPQDMKADLIEVLTLPGYKCCQNQSSKASSRYTLCCRSRGVLVTNLPNKEPFEIFSPIHSCKNVLNMKSSLNTMRIFFRSNMPSFSTVMGLSGTINVCSYMPNSYNHSCHCKLENAVCSSQKTCECAPNYFGDGIFFCDPLTNSPCNSKCSKNAQCINLVSEKMSDSRDNFCQCNEGYEGNGFICQPSCDTKPCPQNSYCIINTRKQKAECHCTKHSVPYNQYCHTNILQTMFNNPQIRQDFTNNMRCFSADIQNKLSGHTDNTINYLLVVPPQSFNNCSEVLQYMIEDFWQGDELRHFHLAHYHENQMIAETIGKSYLKIKLIQNNSKEATLGTMLQSVTFLKINDIIVTDTIPFMNGFLVYVNDSLPIILERPKHEHEEPYHGSRFSKQQFNSGKAVGWIILTIVLSATIIGLYALWVKKGFGWCHLPRIKRPFYVTDSGSQIIRFATDNIDEIEITESPTPRM